MGAVWGSKGKLDFYAEGQAAAEAGLFLAANPYPPQRAVAHEAWAKGYVKRAEELGREGFALEPGLWWLSFADPDLPAGRQFLGVAIVQADSMFRAIEKTHATGINPGGEIQTARLPDGYPLPDGVTDRLLSAADLRANGLVDT